MDQGQGQERTQQLSDDPDRAAAQLRTEIEDARTDLGDTVEALAAKTDVKARAHEKADELKAKVSGAMPSSGTGGEGGGVASSASSGLTQARTWARQNPVPTAALGAAIGGFLIGRLTRRER
jgi:ElaB/YqjD/DUF883 family membrane-anchored ribosome-binding protein